MNKQQRLIQDLAKLFVRYNIEDWRVLIDTLNEGGSAYEPIVRAIEELSTKKQPKKKLVQRRGKDRFMAELAKSNPQRAALLKNIMEKLESKALAPRLTDLRELCLGLGIKKTLPIKRPDAIAFVLKHFAKMDDETLARALERIPTRDRDLQDEYNRWFRMISTS